MSTPAYCSASAEFIGTILDVMQLVIELDGTRYAAPTLELYSIELKPYLRKTAEGLPSGNLDLGSELLPVNFLFQQDPGEIEYFRYISGGYYHAGTCYPVTNQFIQWGTSANLTNRLVFDLHRGQAFSIALGGLPKTLFTKYIGHDLQEYSYAVEDNITREVYFIGTPSWMTFPEGNPTVGCSTGCTGEIKLKTAGIVTEAFDDSYYFTAFAANSVIVGTVPSTAPTRFCFYALLGITSKVVAVQTIECNVIG
jgi:hypothetical protein